MSHHLTLGRRALDADASDAACIRYGQKLEAARNYLYARGIAAWVVGSTFTPSRGPRVLVGATR